MGIQGGTTGARLTGVLAATLAGLLLAGCSDPSTAPARPSSPPLSSIPVTVKQPHAVGPFPVGLRVGLPVLTADRCDPAQPHRACSADGELTWIPVGGAAPATVTDVRTHLADQHTSWTTVVAFAAADAEALRRLSRSASNLGGIVLVLDLDGRVLAAIPPSTLHAERALLRGLGKSEAWAVVQAFPRG